VLAHGQGCQLSFILFLLFIILFILGEKPEGLREISNFAAYHR
jgi:hypothetical protein